LRGLKKEKILKNQSSIENNLKEIDEYSKKIKADTDKNIENITSEIKIFENKLTELKTSYNEYIKNNVLAKDLENLLLKVEKSIKELYSLRFNKNSLKEKVFSLENKIKNIKIDIFTTRIMNYQVFMGATK